MWKPDKLNNSSGKCNYQIDASKSRFESIPTTTEESLIKLTQIIKLFNNTAGYKISIQNPTVCI